MLHAFCVVAEEQAKEAAREAERAVADGESLGPLHRVPIGTEDLIATEGSRTTFGSCMDEEFLPDRDSVVVQRTEDAGDMSS